MKSYLFKLYTFIPVLAVFSIPIYFSKNYWYFFSNPKFILISIFGISSLVLTLFFLCTKRIELSLEKKKILVLMLLFLGILCITSLTSTNIPVSFFGTFDRSTGFLTIFFSFLSALPLIFLDKNNDIINTKIPKAFIFSGIIVSFFSYLGSYGFNLDGTVLKATLGGGTLGNTTFAGGFLIFSLFFSMILFFLDEKNKKWWIISFLFILLSPIFVNITKIGFLFSDPIQILGQARAAVLGFFGAFVVGIIVYFSFNKDKYIKYISHGMLLALFIGALSVGLLFFKTGSFFNQLFIQYASGTRFIFWESTLKAIAEKPFLGWGLETFPIAFQKFFDSDIFLYGEYWIDKPHNAILEITYSGGFIAIITYLVLFLFIFLSALSFAKQENIENRKIGLLIFALFLAYFFQNLFAFDTISSYLAFFITIVWFFSFKDLKNLVFKNRNIGDVLNNSIITILFMICGILLYLIPIRFALESKGIQKISSTNVGERVSVLDKYRSFSPAGGSYEEAYITARIYQVYEKEIGKKDEFIEVRRAEIEEFIGFLKKNSEEDVYPYRSYLLVSQFSNLHSLLDVTTMDQYMINLSKEYSYKAIQISPNNPFGYSAASQAHLLDNDFEQSLRFAEMIIGMNPYIPDGYDISINLLSLVGDEKSINKKIQRAKTFIPDYEYEK